MRSHSGPLKSARQRPAVAAPPHRSFLCRSLFADRSSARAPSRLSYPSYTLVSTYSAYTAPFRQYRGHIECVPWICVPDSFRRVQLNDSRWPRMIATLEQTSRQRIFLFTLATRLLQRAERSRTLVAVCHTNASAGHVLVELQGTADVAGLVEPQPRRDADRCAHSARHEDELRNFHVR